MRFGNAGCSYFVRKGNIEMRSRVEGFVASLMSRKFLLTVLGSIALYNNKQYTELVVLLLGYVGVEGGADLVSRYKTRTLTASDIENAVSQNDDDPDTSSIVTGNSVTDTPLFDEEIKED